MQTGGHPLVEVLPEWVLYLITSPYVGPTKHPGCSEGELIVPPHSWNCTNKVA